MPIYVFIRVVSFTAGLLLLIFLAMFLGGTMLWGLLDFLIAGILIGGASLLFEFVRYRSSNSIYRYATGLMIVTAVLLIWINLAVGIIGSEDNPANVLYVATLIALFIGSIAARFRALGMYRALLATAIVQAAVPFAAMIIWQPALTLGVLQVLAINAIFVALWIGSALLFKQAHTN